MFNQAEAERRKLEAVIRGTDQPVIITNAEGVILLMNQAARQAFSMRQPGTGMLLPHVVQDPILRTLFHQARISGRVQRSEIDLKDDRTLSATVTPIPDVGFVAMMQDITQFKQLSKLKSEFVSTVSHDLRSPLSTVLSLLDVLDQVGSLNEQQQDFVTGAKQEVIRLIDLTAELLDLGHLEAGMDMEMEPCDMRDIVTESMENWHLQIADQRHALEIDLPPEPLFVRGNTKRLRQVVDNLISNAVKYTPAGGRIAVHMTREGKEIILRVQDSGIGIALQDQPYVFDHFFRVRNEQTRGIAGTGLGLAIVKSIVERHGGRVWVESEIGKGSTFGVALPMEAYYSSNESDLPAILYCGRIAS
jgi:signal transduction histidine kinase